MGFLICVACLFSFPKPAAADIDDVRFVIERTYSQRSYEQGRQPWNEIGGPYAKVRLLLLTPQFGIADATLTSVGPHNDQFPLQSISTWVSSRSVRVTVKKAAGEWAIFRPE